MMSARSRSLQYGLRLALVVSWSLPLAAGGALAEQSCREPGHPATAVGRFADNGDGTLTDTTRGLRWKRCSEGQSWSNSTCIGKAATYNWPQALALAQEARFAGFDDWRVPARDELKSILDPACTDPAIDLTLFPATPSFAYWSATPFEHFIRLGWAVYFGPGRDGYSPKDYAYFHVRLVRDAD